MVPFFYALTSVLEGRDLEGRDLEDYPEYCFALIVKAKQYSDVTNWDTGTYGSEIIF